MGRKMTLILLKQSHPMHYKHFLHENTDQLQSNILQKIPVLGFAADRSWEASGVTCTGISSSLGHSPSPISDGAGRFYTGLWAVINQTLHPDTIKYPWENRHRFQGSKSRSFNAFLHSLWLTITVWYPRTASLLCRKHHLTTAWAFFQWSNFATNQIPPNFAFLFCFVLFPHLWTLPGRVRARLRCQLLTILFLLLTLLDKYTAHNVATFKTYHIKEKEQTM